MAEKYTIEEALRDTTFTTHTWSQTSSPLQRRRSIGDTASRIDIGGYWLHITSDIHGVPKIVKLLEVDDAVAVWHYLDETEQRAIERLPKQGVFVYLW